jgi:DNA-binding transcriptional MerR regulator
MDRPVLGLTLPLGQAAGWARRARTPGAKVGDDGMGRDGTDRLLTIGEFSRRSRLSLKALRLYERLGLLVPDRVDATGYRRYREGQLAAARLVVMLRRLDMPLARVAEVLAAAGPRAAEVLGDYWDETERRFASQRALVAHLRIRLTGGEGRYDMYQVKQRDVPDQVVVTEQRHILVPELSAWLSEAMVRNEKAAQALGGVSGPGFVIFYGEVSEDSRPRHRPAVGRLGRDGRGPAPGRGARRAGPHRHRAGVPVRRQVSTIVTAPRRRGGLASPRSTVYQLHRVRGKECACHAESRCGGRSPQWPPARSCWAPRS